MKAKINYKGAEFELKNVKRIKVMMLPDLKTNRVRKYIIFEDMEFDTLIYELKDIKAFTITE